MFLVQFIISLFDDFTAVFSLLRPLNLCFDYLS